MKPYRILYDDGSLGAPIDTRVNAHRVAKTMAREGRFRPAAVVRIKLK